MNQRLIIRISQHSLSFSTPQESKVVFTPYAVKNSISMAANMREALRTLPLLDNVYDRATLLVDTPVLTIPTNLFQEDQQEMLYHHAYTQQKPEVVMHYVLPDLNATLVFAIQKGLYQVVRDHFEQLRTIPANVPIWSHAYQKNFTGKAQKLFGYFHDQRLEVFAFGQNRFKFCNSFAVTQADDALYYLLSVWKQLGLEAREDELHLAGDMPERDTLIQKARTFIKRVLPSNPSGEFNRAQVTQITDMPYDLMLYYLKGL